jgi:hypothetical protein
MTAEQVLDALAMLGVVKQAGADTLGNFLAVTGGDHCPHIGEEVYLCGLLLEVASRTNFDLDTLVDEHRSKAIALEGPGGFA